MSGVAETGWCGGAFGVREEGGGRMMLGGTGFWRRRWWTNVDMVMLVVLVEGGGVFVIWCGDGEYQLEIGGTQAGS